MTTQPKPTFKQLSFLQSCGFQYQETLGVGAFALVVLAEKKGKRFSIKLNTELKAHQREELILRSLGRHPTIARYYGSWSNSSLQAIRMSYIEGTPLLDILMESPLTEVEAHRLFLQLALGMQHAHETRRVAHRDLKAENLIISPDQTRLWIIDWGMGIECSEFDTHSLACGSPDYAAPEIYQQKPYRGPELDIWSMGVILYGMVTGKFPFAGASATETAYRIVRGAYPDPEVSPALCDLISKMLTVSQMRRITNNEILAHPWIQETHDRSLSDSLSSSPSAHSLRSSEWRSDIFAPPPELVPKRVGKRHPARRKVTSNIRSKRSRPRSAPNHVADVEKTAGTPNPAIQILSVPCFSTPQCSSSTEVSRDQEPLPNLPKLPRFSLLFWKKNQSLGRSTSKSVGFG